MPASLHIADAVPREHTVPGELAPTIRARLYQSPRQQERGARILSVTRQMLTETGYHGVTMRGVSDRASVARKTLYDRYGSKDALVLAAVGEVLDDVAANAEALAAGDDGIGSVLARYRASFQQIIRAPNYAAAMAHALFDAAPGSPLIDLLLAARVRQVRAALARAQSRGELVPGCDIDALARTLLAQSWGVILLWMKGLVRLDDIEAEIGRAQSMTLLAVTAATHRDRLHTLLWEHN